MLLLLTNNKWFIFYVLLNFQIFGKTSVKVAPVTKTDEPNSGFKTKRTKESKEDDAVVERTMNSTECDLWPTLFDTDEAFTVRIDSVNAVDLGAMVAGISKHESLVEANMCFNKPVVSEEQIESEKSAKGTTKKMELQKQTQKHQSQSK